jgi:predicted dehydrogenase
VFIYDEQGRAEVPCQRWDGPLKVELDEFHRSITEDRAMPHDGHWGKATLEVCLAILQSSQDQREHRLMHQVTSPY